MTDRDWGSDTLSRFRYQAEATLPYCLSMLSSNDDILAVIPEHLEDIALETERGWRFLQVKTRNPERGLWTASHLFSKKGGALRSLYRTYLLTKPDNASLELLLEGAVKTQDPIQALYPNQDREPLVSKVVERFRVTRAVAADFLGRVTLNDSLTDRAAIHATNGRLIHEMAPSLIQPELEALHTSLLSEIERAMRCEPLGPWWPRSIIHPDRRSTPDADRLRPKTLDPARLGRMADSLSREARPLLRRFVKPTGRAGSPLVQKLLSGGAPQAIVEDARVLRANAMHQRFVRESLNLEHQSAVLNDLQARLLTHAHVATATHRSSVHPAIDIWRELLQTFHSNAPQIDRHNIVKGDPMLLMGEACILSDECAFGWKVASDAS